MFFFDSSDAIFAFLSSDHCIQQSTGDVGALQPHDAFLCSVKAEKVDAAVPYGFGVDHSKFLVKSAFESDCDAKFTEQSGILSG